MAIVSALLTYLALAHDTNAWPYGGPSWIGVAAGSIVALGGLVLIIVRHMNGSLGAWPLASGLTAILVGAIVGTATVFSSGDQQGPGIAAPRAEITSLKDGQTIDGPVTLSGTVSTPLRQGESLWLFVGTLPASGNSADYFYLQFGPCEESHEQMTWRCTSISLANTGPRRVRIYLTAVRDGDPPKLVQRLTEGAVFDYKTSNDIPPGRNDPRNERNLADFGDVVVLDAVTIGLGR